MAYTKTLRLYAPFYGYTAHSQAPSWSLQYGGNVSLSGARTGERVTGFRQRIKNGQSASSPYSSSFFRIDNQQSGDIIRYWGQKDGLGPGRDRIYWEKGYGYAFNPVTEAEMQHPSLSWTAVEAAAIAKLYERIKAVRSQMNGLQFLGELRQTIHMIRNPVNALIKGLTNYHDAVKSKATRNIRGVPLKKRAAIVKDTASGLWLEYSYGWKPLLNDVKGIAETAGRIVAERQQVRDSATSTVTGTPVKTFNQHNAPYGILGNLYLRTISSYESTAGVSWSVGLSSDVVAPIGSLARAAQLSGFTLENFVPTLWELVPFSFVAEYFSNIGDIIEASCMSTAGITWKSKSNRTVTQLTKVAYPGNTFPKTAPFYDIGGQVSKVGHYGSLVISKTSLTRTVPTSLPIPDLTLHLPGSVNKYANLAALLLVRFRTTSRGLAT